jgi:hypothetical protein
MLAAEGSQDFHAKAKAKNQRCPMMFGVVYPRKKKKKGKWVAAEIRLNGLDPI